ncbi:MAG: hypothetical protein PWP24_809 [Clostridiales bacterium]|nr:hypothetical protein [Clostridiales bacterium]
MKQEPLTESYYYILLCLFHEPSHGYGIMQKVLALSNERVKIGSGTMYGAISNMIKKKWIIETTSTDPQDDRKRLYEMTELGKLVLLEEIKRLRELVENADMMINQKLG